jgi:hypothetical protein
MGRVRGLLFSSILLASTLSACATKQVCECAVYVGGMPPANDEEQAARSRAVRECLDQHGGGTIGGCPLPASTPR